MELEIRVVSLPTVHLDVLRDGMRGALYESMALAEKEVKERVPIGVGGQAGLKGSIFSEVKEFPSYLQGLTSTPLAYGAPVEFGRSAGAKMPPVSALIPWVEQFIALKEHETAKGVAFAIARYMAARGSRAWRQSPPGVRMFEQAFEAAQPKIEAIFQRAVGEIAVRVLTNQEGH